MRKPEPKPAARPTLKPDSLALSLLAAAYAVAGVKSGTALPQALAQTATRLQLTPQARGAAQDLAYRTMRQLGRAETLLGAMTQKPPEPALLHGLMCCALALLSEPDGAAYEPFTLVNQAVDAAASEAAIAHAKGMVNAVLRRYLRESAQLLAEALRNPVAHWNYPAWWIDTTKAAYPKQWQEILQAGNGAPPMTLRINVRKTTIAAYLDMLEKAGIAATQIGPSAVRLAQALPVARIPGFEAGLSSVQDAGAQLAAPLLDVRDGMRVLDACAAPGGKTGHLLELADIELLAMDSDPQRLVRIRENLDRLQLRARLAEGDAARRTWWDGQPYDRILADVPCTASGVLRRHPDIRWLRRKADTAQLSSISRQILDNLWSMLRPGGKLLFVTCSLWPQESTAQADAFAERNGAQRLPAPGQLLPGGEHDQDGLFYALFEKSA